MYGESGVMIREWKYCAERGWYGNRCKSPVGIFRTCRSVSGCWPYCFVTVRSQNFEGYCGAGLRIGEGVVVILQIETALRRYGMQSVVGERLAEGTPRGAACTQKFVSGIRHGVYFECRPQTSFVERAVVGYESETVYSGRHSLPYFRKQRSVYGIVISQSVNACSECRIVVGTGAYEAVYAVGYFAAAHDDYSYAAYARAVGVGRLEIYSCEILHSFILFAG